MNWRPSPPRSLTFFYASETPLFALGSSRLSMRLFLLSQLEPFSLLLRLPLYLEVLLPVSDVHMSASDTLLPPTETLIATLQAIHHVFNVLFPIFFY